MFQDASLLRRSSRNLPLKLSAAPFCHAAALYRLIGTAKLYGIDPEGVPAVRPSRASDQSDRRTAAMELHKRIRRPVAPSRVVAAKRSVSTAKGDGEPTLYRLHVELLEIHPTIWRRLRVPGWISLAKLHLVLQAAMGWTNSHLHQFEIAGTKYGIPDDEWPELVVVDDRRVTLAGAIGATVTDFRYEYDFGDGWAHAVHVEARESVEDDVQHVLCLAGANACPPEDVGGPGGYADFLKAIRNPRHPEHADYLRWCGGAFDPAGFDLNSVNSALRRLKITSRR